MTEAEQYANDVLSGKEVAGKLMHKACQRFLNDLKRTDIFFNEEEANTMILFGEKYCLQWEGDWQGLPVKFEPWQKFIFQQLFGWIRKDNGRRRFNKTYIQVAKKNGKSTICGILANFHLFADERVNTPKVFTAANNEDQAKICVNIAGKIVEESPDLYEYVQDKSVKLSTYGINITEVIHKERNGFIKALSKESDDKKGKTVGGKHGINASMGIVDEFGMSPDYGASKPIETSMASRSEYLMAYITTAGFNKDGPCFRELRALGIKVLDGVVEMDNYLPIIFEMDRPLDDNGKEQAITCEWLLANRWAWKQCNPNLGVSVYEEFLLQMLKDAANLGGSTEVEVLTLNFNLWMDSPEVWIPADTWNKNTHGVTLEELDGKECFAGLDILQGNDLNSLVLLFPNIRPDIHAVLPFFWMAQGKVISNIMKHDCSDWVKEGFIKTCPGDAVDNYLVYTSLLLAFERYQINSLACSVKLVNHDILQGLVADGIECNPISTGYGGQSTPTAMWEEFATGKKIEHFGNPVLSWMNSNCLVIRSKDMDMKIQRINGRTSGTIACVYALAQWKTIEANPEPELGLDYVQL